MKRNLTWEQITDLEPRLLEVAAAARFAGEGETCFCRQSAWYGMDRWRDRGFKDRVSVLVGWEREDFDRTERVATLMTSEAYNIAYEYVLHLLPECRKCSGHMTDEYLDLKDAGLDTSEWC